MRFSEISAIKPIKPIKPLTLDQARVKDLERQDLLIKQRLKRERFRQQQKRDLEKQQNDLVIKRSGY